MEIERDPSDLGIRYAGDPDEEPVDLAELFAPEPARVPALPEQRAAARAIAGVRSPRSSLGAPCGSCGAGPARWCRRTGREVVGFVHPSRAHTTD